MANQDVIGVTKCNCCNQPVEVRRNKAGKLYYFCDGSIGEGSCLHHEKYNGSVSKRAIAASAKSGTDRPYFKNVFTGEIKKVKSNKVKEVANDKEENPNKESEQNRQRQSGSGKPERAEPTAANDDGQTNHDERAGVGFF